MIDPLWMAAVAGMTMGAAWVGHTLGTAPLHRRRQLHRALAHRYAAWGGAALLAVSWIWPEAPPEPRRYADYLSTDAGPGFPPVLGPLLACTGLVLLASWLRARRGGAAGRLGSVARHAPTAVGVLLVVAGIVVWLRCAVWAPQSFEIYLFSLPPEAETSPLDWAPRLPASVIIDITVTGVGLAVLAALAGHQVGRRIRHRSDAQGK